MANDRLTIQVSTYNINQRYFTQDPHEWLFPKYDGPKPDIFAIGFQELEPYSVALLGVDRRQMNDKATILGAAIQKGTGEAYTVVSQVKLVGVAMFLYARDATCTSAIRNVRFTTTSFGPLFLGNKGAVGVQMEIKTSKGSTGITFVCAHLTAHDHNLLRRNADYASIVGRLVFPPPMEGDSDQVKLQSAQGEKTSSKDEKGSWALERLNTIYSMPHLFFFGDLNYRITLQHGDVKVGLTREAILEGLSPPPVTEKEEEAPPPLTRTSTISSTRSTRSSLLEYDQLSIEKKGGRVMQGLNEGEIDFAPSYKYKVGTVDEFHPIAKRVPGWCDRILYLQHDTKVLFYSSFKQYTLSDHKPITGIYSISTLPNVRGTSAPVQIDPNWWNKKIAGLILDRIVGLAWVGLGTKEGLPITLAMLATVYAYLYFR